MAPRFLATLSRLALQRVFRAPARAFFPCLLLLAVSVLGGHGFGAPPGQGMTFAQRIGALEEAGDLGRDEALLLRFQFVFAPDQLPEEFKTGQFVPTRCATDLVRSFRAQEERLSPALREQLEGYIEQTLTRSQYLSSGGHFQLNYQTSGEDAVPLKDEDPADGVPDFINALGVYLEHAYTVEVLMVGFADPLRHGGPYQVYFQDMQSYGYTQADPSQPSGTVMVLHNDYEGFPANEDPDGQVWGAAKVSAAHEFKHASQYMGSQWAEGGWIELDAVWAEDLAFDQTNDFYSYLWWGSPIRNPETPLDDGGTGSYEDCVLQTCMQELWGAQAVVDFWERRADHGGESVLDSYARVVEARGGSWAWFWSQFTAWNFATAHRTLTGLGYAEATAFPYGAVSAHGTAYPCQLSGEVAHLAATFLQLDDLGHEAGQLVLELTGDAGSPPLMAAVVVQRGDGTGLLEIIEAGQGPHTVSVDLPDMVAAAVVVSNPATSGESRPFTLTARRQISQPQPLLDLAQASLRLSLEGGESRVVGTGIANQGEAGSTLNFRASVWDRDPTVYLTELAARSEGDKSVAGSSLSVTPDAYLPGQPLTVILSLTNSSPDEEWLRELQLTLPAGVNLLDATAFSGGSQGDMAWDGLTGAGVTTSWFGTSGALEYGVVCPGETASATLELAVDAGFSGDLDLTGTLWGDDFGFAPHSLPVSVTLHRSWSQLALTAPGGSLDCALGEAVEIAWNQDGSLDTVAVSLSRDGGQSWEDLGQSSAAAGGFTWLATGAPTTRGVLRLTGQPGDAVVTGPSTVTLFPPSEMVKCLTPAGVVDQGQSMEILLDCRAPDTGAGSFAAWLVVQADGAIPQGLVPVQLDVTPVAASPGETPATPGLRGNFPNPFNPATRLQYYLPRGGAVSLDILDLRGARVRRLVGQTLDAGLHQVAWDGRDDAGRALPTGLYLARLRAPGLVDTHKMVLAK